MHKYNSLYDKLLLVEKFVPPVKRFHEALEGVAKSVEYILFVLQEMKPETKRMEKNITKLKENVEIFKKSLEQHGFIEEADQAS